MPDDSNISIVKLIGAAALLALAGGCAPASHAPVGADTVRLSHPDPAERLATIACLDRDPVPEARPVLLRLALEDPESRVRRAAALTLEAQTGDSLEHLAVRELERTQDVDLAGAMMSSRLDVVQVSAIDFLRRSGTPKAWGLLAERMGRDGSPGVRLLCAQAAAEGVARGAGSAHQALLTALRRGLSDATAEVRQVCARALAGSGDPSGAAVLASGLPKASPAERGEIVGLLRVATGEDLGEDVQPWMDRFGAAREQSR